MSAEDERSRAEDDLARLADELTRRLAEHGWSVVLQHHPAAYEFRFDHPLSQGVGYALLKTQAQDARTKVERFLEQEPEFSIISAKPIEAPHAHIIRGFRAAASNFSWDPPVLEQIAWVLLELGVLDPAEAEWLAGSLRRSTDT